MQILQEMQTEDIDAVLAVIESQDDDDAEVAEPGYRQIGGCMDQFVARIDGKIVGITGYATPPGCDETHWLSWTYVHSGSANKGLGRKMLNDLIGHLKESGCRKLFVKVSDYSSEEDGAIYAAALHLYQTLGFEIEITHNDYYDEGESVIILGLRLSDQPPGNQDAQEENVPVKFNSVFEIADTDDAYTFGWHDEGSEIFTKEDVILGLDSVKSKEGRDIFLSFPSNFAGIREPLLAAGFKESGKLIDYYEDGIHEQHYTYKF